MIFGIEDIKARYPRLFKAMKSVMAWEMAFQAMRKTQDKRIALLSFLKKLRGKIAEHTLPTKLMPFINKLEELVVRPQMHPDLLDTKQEVLSSDDEISTLLAHIIRGLMRQFMWDAVQALTMSLRQIIGINLNDAMMNFIRNMLQGLVRDALLQRGAPQAAASAPDTGEVAENAGEDLCASVAQAQSDVNKAEMRGMVGSFIHIARGALSGMLNDLRPIYSEDRNDNEEKDDFAEIFDEFDSGKAWAVEPEEAKQSMRYSFFYKPEYNPASVPSYSYSPSTPVAAEPSVEYGPSVPELDPEQFLKLFNSNVPPVY